VKRRDAQRERLRKEFQDGLSQQLYNKRQTKEADALNSKFFDSSMVASDAQKMREEEDAKKRKQRESQELFKQVWRDQMALKR